MCPWSGYKKWRSKVASCGESLTEILTYTRSSMTTQNYRETKHLLCISLVISAISVSPICKYQLPSSLHSHRSEIVQSHLNDNFSVQLNSCWRSSLLGLPSENSTFPFLNPLRGSRERERRRETKIQCWQGHNLPSLHTLFTVSLPAAIPSSLNRAIKNK